MKYYHQSGYLKKPSYSKLKTSGNYIVTYNNSRFPVFFNFNFRSFWCVWNELKIYKSVDLCRLGMLAKLISFEKKLKQLTTKTLSVLKHTFLCVVFSHRLKI